METTGETILSQFARVELEVTTELEAVDAKCSESVAAARRDAERELAEIPSQLQKERKELIEATREQAQQRADAIRQAAYKKADELSTVVGEMTEDIVHELLQMVLPHSSNPNDSEIGQP